MTTATHQYAWGLLAFLVAACATPGCRKSQQKPQGEEHGRRTVTSAAPSMSAPSASASVAAKTRPPADRSPVPPAASVPCIANGKKGQHSLGTVQGAVYYDDLRVWGDWVYVLTSLGRSGKVYLHALKRDGSAKKKLGSFVGMAPMEGLAMDVGPGAVFVTLRGKLWRFSMNGGDAQKVADDFGWPVAVYGDAVYGVRCKKSKRDELVSVPLQGGEAKTLATIPRKKSKCKYRGIAVNGKYAFVADWSDRLLIRVSLDGGEVKNLITHIAFPTRVFVRGEVVDVTSSEGLQRVSIDGGETKVVMMPGREKRGLGVAPFVAMAADDDAYWLMQGRPYEPEEWIWRVSRSDLKASKVMRCPKKKYIEQDSVIHAIGVDDQCLYYTIDADKYFVVYARRKPE